MQLALLVLVDVVENLIATFVRAAAHAIIFVVLLKRFSDRRNHLAAVEDGFVGSVRHLLQVREKLLSDVTVLLVFIHEARVFGVDQP